MAMEIRELLAEGKRMAASTIKKFYQQKTNPRRKTIEVIQRMDQQRKE
jgi:hypothetical protein